jgi:hypothetical protein
MNRFIGFFLMAMARYGCAAQKQCIASSLSPSAVIRRRNSQRAMWFRTARVGSGGRMAG